MTDNSTVTCRYAAIAALAILGACTVDKTKQVDTTRVVAAAFIPKAMPTCGGDRAFFIEAVKKGLVPVPADTWSTWEFPEYQDEQRFQNPGNQGFGQLACVVANPNLATIPVNDYSGEDGVLVAMVFVTDDGEAPGPAYQTLKLNTGFNCIRLKLRGINNWKGYTSAPNATGHCTKIPVSGAIESYRMAANDIPMGDYPPVARFVLKKPNSAAPGVTLGVQCGDGWCTIGMPNDTDMPNPATPPAPIGGHLNDAGHVRRSVYGWFDDQILSVKDESKPTKLRPFARAMIIPDYRLGGYTIEGNFDKALTPVATILFHGDPKGTKYESHWGFTNSDNPLTANNELSIRHTGAGPDDWEVQIDGFARPNLHVHYNPHTNATIIGTARWAWRNDDEGIWVRCGSGCCEIEPDDSQVKTIPQMKKSGG